MPQILQFVVRTRPIGNSGWRNHRFGREALNRGRVAGRWLEQYSPPALPSPNSQLPSPNSQVPTPKSQLPTPNYQVPTPEERETGRKDADGTGRDGLQTTSALDSAMVCRSGSLSTCRGRGRHRSIQGDRSAFHNFRPFVGSLTGEERIPHHHHHLRAIKPPTRSKPKTLRSKLNLQKENIAGGRRRRLWRWWSRAGYAH